MIALKTKGIDFAGASIDPHDAVAKGFKFFFRYSAGMGNKNPNTAFKLCRDGEIQRITDAGGLFVANSEWYETRITEGYAAGKADGQADCDFWNKKGLSHGASIYNSWDTAPVASQFNAVQDYMHGYRDGLQGVYINDGMYAGIPALVYMAKAGVINKGWIPSAAGWSVAREMLPPNYAPPAQTSWDLWQPTPSQYDPAMAYLLNKIGDAPLSVIIWQDHNYAYGTGADEDYIIRAGYMGGHNEKNDNAVGQTSVAVKNTIKETDDMILIFRATDAPADAPSHWVEMGGNISPITTPEVENAYLSCGLPVAAINVPMAEINERINAR